MSSHFVKGPAVYPGQIQPCFYIRNVGRSA